jgi:hypothetical protein
MAEWSVRVFGPEQQMRAAVECLSGSDWALRPSANLWPPALRIVAAAQQAEAEAQAAEEPAVKRPVTDAFARGRGI